MENNSGNSTLGNPKWIEEDLLKLPCKELKKLARKSHVNPNFKKAELVKALLHSSTAIVPVLKKSELKENDKTTRRMTRSRVSIYQHTNEVQDIVNKVQIINIKKQSDVDVNDLVVEDEKKMNRKGKQKRESVRNSVSDLFKMVSSIKTKSKPLLEITNKKTESIIGETNLSDKPLNKKSRQSEPKMKLSLRNAEIDVQSSTEKVGNIQNESEPQSCDTNDCNLCKNEKEDSCSLNINEVLDDKNVKGKRKGRKRKLEEQSVCPKLNVTNETVKETVISEIESDKNEKPKVEKKRRLKKQKIDEEMSLNLKENSKKIPDIEIKITEENHPTGPKLGNRKTRRGKASKSEVVKVSNNKDISGVLTLSNSVSLSIQNNSSMNEELVDTSVNKKRSSRNSKVSTEMNISVGKNNDTVLDLFADDMVDATHAGNLSNTSGKRSSIETVMPVAVPLRSSTFILDSPNSENNSSGKKKQYDKPSRSHTFTIDENDDESLKSGKPKRSSLHFVAGPGAKRSKPEMSKRTSLRASPVDKKPKPEMPKRTSLRFEAVPALQQTSSPSLKPKKVEKSIGKRIMSAFVKKTNTDSAVKNEKPTTIGSSVKKTITKSTTTPAYLHKFGGVRKAPNFKNIHQKLFKNMESLGDNHKRKLERALDLIHSPAPRCAVSGISPRVSLERMDKTAPAQTPMQPSAPLTKSKTPGTVSAPVQLNRFGFKTRINKVEANTIVGKKLPPIRMEKTKEKDRKFLQGVRTNKRFMLQMQMRQNTQ